MRRLPLLLLAACGPSYQALYEGDARFEHCYAVDESASTSMTQKAACWDDWTRRYTYGQTRDRVEYASARRRALAQAPELPTDEALMQAAPGMTGDTAQLVAPAPTSAFAPPPVTMALAPARVAPRLPEGPASPEARSANVACVDACTAALSKCRAKRPKCVADHDACVGGCVSR